MFIKRTKIFPKYFLKMIGGATFVFGGSTQNLLGVPLGVPIGGASGSPNGVPQKKNTVVFRDEAPALKILMPP